MARRSGAGRDGFETRTSREQQLKSDINTMDYVPWTMD